MKTKFLALSLAMLLGACASSGVDTAGSSSSVLPNVDLLGPNQLPVGTKIYYQDSLIIGSGDNWVGRVLLEVGGDSMAAYNFFTEQYPQQGWALLSAIRGKTSLLVFTRQGRSATVEIIEGGGMLSSTVVRLTVTPANAVTSAPRKP